MSEAKDYSYLVEQWAKYHVDIDLKKKTKIDEKFADYIRKIESEEFTLVDYTNRKAEGDYFCTFLENETSDIYGSSSAGRADFFGIKKNDDESYYISGKVSGIKENKKADIKSAETEFKKIVKNLKEIITFNSTADCWSHVEKINIITSKVMLRKIVAMNSNEDYLYIYSDDGIDTIYDFFIGGDSKPSRTNIEKNYTITKEMKRIFGREIDMVKMSMFIWSIFGSTIQLEAKNMILHGAPGTGKTYSVKNTVKNIILKQGGSIEEQLTFTQFHPSYSYEDFMDGIKPVGIENGQMQFELKNGMFKELCKKAMRTLKTERKEGKTDLTKFFFVADEVNRAELSRVFGELLICLEDDYRIDFDEQGNILKEENLIELQNSSLDTNPVYEKEGKNRFGVPANLYFIGTMNDIDRSVDSFDMALRRRFFWKEIRCNYDYIQSLFLNSDYTRIIKNLNRFITGYTETKKNNQIESVEKIGNKESLRLGTSFELGHAYFKDIKSIDTKEINALWNSKLKPLLREYLRAEYSQDQIEVKLIEAKEIFTLPKQ